MLGFSVLYRTNHMSSLDYKEVGTGLPMRIFRLESTSVVAYSSQPSSQHLSSFSAFILANKKNFYINKFSYDFQARNCELLC